MNRRWTLARLVLSLTIFILPLKFGGIVGSGDQPVFPRDVWEWLFFTCLPSWLAPVLGGVCLVLVLVCYPVPRRRASLLVPLLWCGFLVAGLSGLAGCTEMDYGIQWLGHFAGAAALCLALWWASASDEKALPWALNAIALTGLLACVHGWHQHFGGLEESRQYALEHLVKKGQQVNETVLAKMAQTRVFGSMADPNVYSAHLLFCLPFSLLGCLSWGRRFERPRLGAGILLALAVILYGCALVWAGSRGALIAGAAASCAAVWALPRIHRWRFRWALPVFAVLLGVALALAIRVRSRDNLASASARMTYYAVAVQVFCQHPLAGAGIGEFFPWYLRLKPLEAEVTREPHNLFLSFACQTGVLGALLVLGFLLLPWTVASIQWRRPPLPWLLAGVFGTTAWFVHSQFQFDELIPGTLYLAALGGLFLFEQSQDTPAEEAPKGHAPARIAALLLAILALSPILRTRGEWLLQQGDSASRQNPVAGLEYFQKAAVALPRNACAWRCSYDIFSFVRDWPKAEAAAVKLVERTPHRSGSYLRLAAIYMAMDRLDSAADTLAKAREWAPWSPEVLVACAVLEFRRTHKLDYLDSLALADETAHCKAWICRTQQGFLVTFDKPAYSILARATANITLPQNIRFASVICP